MKWGAVLSFLMGGAGWMMGQARDNGVAQFGMRNIATGIGAFLWEMINKPSNNAAAAARQRGSRTGSSSRSKSKLSSTRDRKAKPKAKSKPWDTFEYHEEWKYEQEAAATGQGGDVQGIFEDIIGRAGKAVKDSGLWDIVKGVVEGPEEDGGHDKVNAKTKKSR